MEGFPSGILFLANKLACLQHPQPPKHKNHDKVIKVSAPPYYLVVADNNTVEQEKSEKNHY